MDRHQHLPLSINRLGCDVIIRGAWMDEEKKQIAIGPVFAKALLYVFWREKYNAGEGEPSKLELSYRDTMLADVDKVLKDQGVPQLCTDQKDELTLGWYSLVNDNATVMQELQAYSQFPGGEFHKDACLQKISELPSLYLLVRRRIYMALIHQQLIESWFSKHDTCTRATDSVEMTQARVGQYRSCRSRQIVATNVTPVAIRVAGSRVKVSAKLLRETAQAAAPLARDQRKRPLGDAEAEALEAACAAAGGSRTRGARVRVAAVAAPEPAVDTEGEISSEESSEGSESESSEESGSEASEESGSEGLTG